MATIKYKGFELSPALHQHAETKDWLVRVTVTKHHDARNETLTKSFSPGKGFKDRGQAETAALEFGKQVVDDEFEVLSVDDLR